MKTLYIECKMGAAGDMLMGALLELSEKKEEFLCRINAFGFQMCVWIHYRLNSAALRKTDSSRDWR